MAEKQTTVRNGPAHSRGQPLKAKPSTSRADTRSVAQRLQQQLGNQGMLQLMSRLDARHPIDGATGSAPEAASSAVADSNPQQEAPATADYASSFDDNSTETGGRGKALKDRQEEASSSVKPNEFHLRDVPPITVNPSELPPLPINDAVKSTASLTVEDSSVGESDGRQPRIESPVFIGGSNDAARSLAFTAQISGQVLGETTRAKLAERLARGPVAAPVVSSVASGDRTSEAVPRGGTGGVKDIYTDDKGVVIPGLVPGTRPAVGEVDRIPADLDMGQAPNVSIGIDGSGFGWDMAHLNGGDYSPIYPTNHEFSMEGVIDAARKTKNPQTLLNALDFSCYKFTAGCEEGAYLGRALHPENPVYALRAQMQDDKKQWVKMAGAAPVLGATAGLGTGAATLLGGGYAATSGTSFLADGAYQSYRITTGLQPKYNVGEGALSLALPLYLRALGEVRLIGSGSGFKNPASQVGAINPGSGASKLGVTAANATRGAKGASEKIVTASTAAEHGGIGRASSAGQAASDFAARTGGTIAGEEFRVANHGAMPSPRPGQQSHHGVMSAWMKEHSLSYDPDLAPAILMPEANHRATFGVYNTWRAEMRAEMGGTFDWAKVSESQMQDLSEKMFDAAQVPATIRQQYWERYLKMKGVLKK